MSLPEPAPVASLTVDQLAYVLLRMPLDDLQQLTVDEPMDEARLHVVGAAGVAERLNQMTFIAQAVSYGQVDLDIGWRAIEILHAVLSMAITPEVV